MRRDVALPPSWLPVGLGFAVLIVTVLMFILVIVWPNPR